MHKNQRHLCRRHDRRQPGVKGQCRNIVHDPRPRRQRRLRHSRLARVDGQGHACIPQRRDHRFGAGDLVRDRNLGSTWPGAFAADIQQSRTVCHHRLRLGQGRRRVQKPAPVGKAVRRHIQDAHDLRAVHRQPCKGLARRGQAGQDSLRHLGQRGQPRRAAPLQNFDLRKPAPAAGKGQGLGRARRVSHGDGAVICHVAAMPRPGRLGKARDQPRSTGTRLPAGTVTEP